MDYNNLKNKIDNYIDSGLPIQYSNSEFYNDLILLNNYDYKKISDLINNYNSTNTGSNKFDNCKYLEKKMIEILKIGETVDGSNKHIDEMMYWGNKIDNKYKNIFIYKLYSSLKAYEILLKK
jgi:hypothetical protein